MNIVLRDVRKRFAGATAVDGLSLDIRPGELVSLVGGSGCGKTTTLRMIAGFETPDSGDILFDGRVVNGVSPRKRGLGIVFQSYALFPTMTVGENIDRKSTRLNSSHTVISYAVFCLKKKKEK